MKKILAYIFCFALTFHYMKASGQGNAEKNLETIIESILENLDEETDVSIVIEDLETLVENPVNINSTNASELSKLHFLNDIQIQKLLQYVNNYGPALTIYELNTIEGFTPDLILQIEPFIQFGNKETKRRNLSEKLKYGRQQILARSLGLVQKPKGYTENNKGIIPYEGNRFRYYTRYIFQSSDDISAGITAEKDPGETFFKGSNKKGFDFYSGHLSFKVNERIENVTVGDFIVRAGQGLVLWQGFSLGKSLNTLNIAKTNQGIRPYTSVDENRFFRGISSTLNFGRGKINIFYSSNKVDGNIIDSDEHVKTFSSLQESGYHRTAHEIDDKNSVRDMNLGTVGAWYFNNLKIGATLIHQKFDGYFQPQSQLYNLYRFKGENNTSGSIDYLFSQGKYQLFGEAAMSKSKGKAFLQGAVAHLHDQLTFSVLFRHFDKDYHALWASSFSEGSSTNNETGLYLGTKILPLKFVQLSFYSDFYRSEWISFSTAGPSNGRDFFSQADFIFSRKFEFYIRYKDEEKDQKMKLNNRYVNHPERIQKARIHAQIKPTESITLKTRLELAGFKGLEKENGYLLFQDVHFNPDQFPFSFSARLAYFNTESYNTRIYAYENDLLYTFSIPAFFGKGLRTYLNLKFSISENLDFWFKVANTSWNDRETISSGYSEISGNNKTELKFQLRLKI